MFLWVLGGYFSTPLSFAEFKGCGSLPLCNSMCAFTAMCMPHKRRHMHAYRRGFNFPQPAAADLAGALVHGAGACQCAHHNHTPWAGRGCGAWGVGHHPQNLGVQRTNAPTVCTHARTHTCIYARMQYTRQQRLPRWKEGTAPSLPAALCTASPRLPP